VKVQLSNSSTFASGIVEGTALWLGAATPLVGADTASTTGRYELPFTNEVNGVVYRYARGYTDVAGTIATGINFTANLVLAA